MRDDYASEVRFWDGVLAGRSHQENLADLLSGGEAHFPKKMLEYNPTDVLEVGSGPLSTLRWGVDTSLLKVTAIDPLANRYAELLLAHGIDYPIKPVFGTGEIVNLYRDNPFDVAYARNSLDHTISPPQVFKAMCMAVDIGDIIYIESSTNEGRRGKYRGLHHHNLWMENGVLMHSVGETEGADISSEYAELIHQDEEPVFLDSEGSFTAIFKRGK